MVETRSRTSEEHPATRELDIKSTPTRAPDENFCEMLPDRAINVGADRCFEYCFRTFEWKAGLKLLRGANPLRLTIF